MCVVPPRVSHQLLHTTLYLFKNSITIEHLSLEKFMILCTQMYLDK